MKNSLMLLLRMKINKISKNYSNIFLFKIQIKKIKFLKNGRFYEIYFKLFNSKFFSENIQLNFFYFYKKQSIFFLY